MNYDELATMSFDTLEWLYSRHVQQLVDLQKQQSEQLISFFSMYKTTFPSAHLSAGNILNEKNSISNHKIQILSYQWD